jgi:hypothetical protein
VVLKTKFFIMFFSFKHGWASRKAPLTSHGLGLVPVQIQNVGSDEPGFTCPGCGKNFENNEALQQHMLRCDG